MSVVEWTIERSIFDGGIGAKVQAMRVSVTDAKAQLTDLVRRAGGGDEVILPRHGRAAVKLVPVGHIVHPTTREALIREVRAAATAKAIAGTDGARSQDFLYDEDGLPG